MSIFHNLSEIKDVYCGDTKIESIYLGTEQVYTGETCPYTPDQVIFEQATAGTYSVDILADGKYEVYVIGGGAGGVGWAGLTASGGGSGAGFIGTINIPKGTFTIIIGTGGNGVATNTMPIPTAGGGGNSSIGALVISYGAPSHVGNDGGGVGGAIPSITTEIISQTLNVAGNKGGYNNNSTSTGITVAGGASVYNNFGAGGYGHHHPKKWSAGNGTAGYVKIIYKGK